MNPLWSFQQAIRRLVFQCGFGPVDLGIGPQPLDPLTREIHTTLFLAIRDAATEIRFVPNERNLKVFALVKDTLEQPLPLPFLKKTVQPIARILKQTLQRCPSHRDVEAAAEGTIHVGGYPVHLSLFSTPTDHGDLLTVRIVDPGLVSGSTEAGAVVDDDEFTLGGFDDDHTPPAPPPSSPEELTWFSGGWKSWDPTIYDTSDG